MPFHDFELRILECATCGGPLPAPSSGMAGQCQYCGAPTSLAREVGVFSHHIRVVVCDGCMAPLPVPVSGGDVTCGYCHATFVLIARKERRLGRPSPLAEDERIARLRKQDRGPIRMPPDIAPLMRGGGLIDESIEPAQAMWQARRRELLQLRAHGDDRARDVELRVYYLTELIADYHNWKQRRLVARAYLEACLEDLQEPRYVQPIYCWLARNAFSTGDPEASQGWFDLCDPAAEELGMDSAYRITWAAVSLAKGDHQAILDALGESRQVIPLNDKYDNAATIYRAHALEHLRSVDEAAQHLLDELGDRLAYWTQAVIIVDAEKRTRLCPESLSRAVTKRWSWPPAVALATAFFAVLGFLLADGILGPVLWGTRLLSFAVLPLGAVWLLVPGMMTLGVLERRVKIRRALGQLRARDA